ncbi:hypothetical protein [Cohnella caldifontis]|uniref:hypothetical protein n=1 Tax=Cohnella caldifontis TaxID=3027471 RepID=UPI0023EB9F13|nr:hypothetical protein [Cohnella sp. YIM B05605]
MNCYFHASNAAVHTCVRCKKELCGECIHSEYPDYCWSCGLDYGNSLDEKPFELPRFAQGRIGQYILVKLAAAGGSWLVFTLIACLVIGLAFDSAAVPLFAIYASFYSICVTYTYGLACAVIIDILQRWGLDASKRYDLYAGLLLGMAFPWLMKLLVHQPHILNLPIHMLSGAVVAYTFYSIQQKRHKKAFIFFLAILSSIPPIFYLLLMARGQIGIYF